MKKSARLFLITLCIVIAGLSVISCNSAVKDELGTVVLDFGGGGTRAIGSDGLPLLNNSRILIKGEGSLSGSFSKEFSSAQGVSLSFPVGDAVRLTVSVLTPSARWSSAPVSFTVASGTNAVSVKLSKKISGLNNLLFTQTKSVTAAHLYDLTIYMDGKSITVPQSNRAEYVVARDSKGRVYVGYKANEPGDPQKLIRYTSEGDGPENITIPERSPGTPGISNISAVINDLTTGVSYVIDSYGAVYQVEENAVNGAQLTALDHLSGPAAIDNGRVVWVGNDEPGAPLSIYVKNIDGTVSGEVEIQRLNIRGCKASDITDIFIRGDYVYVLFKTVNETAEPDDNKLYSLGGVVRYNISDVINNAADNPVKIGFDNHPDFENGVLKNYDYSRNFYGAVKIIGFDEDNIYIADDGFDAAMTDAGPKIVKNRNRIAALNMETNELTFTDAGPAKWYTEWKEWTDVVDTKTIVWNKTYDLDSVSSSMEFKKTTFKEHGSSDELFETESNKNGLFAFDQSGVLYIPYTDRNDNKIKRFVQKDNGTYEVAVGESTFPTRDFPGSMAVDTSRSHSFEAQKTGGSSETAYYNVLYCSDSNNNINRFVWTDNFTAAFKDNSYTIQEMGWKITALAANKDGLFAALWKRNSSPETYGIKIKHYDKVSGRLLKTVDLIPESTPEEADGFSIYETITDMHIQDGVLYAVTAKKMEEESGSDLRLLTSGKLWYVSTTADFGDNKRVLYASSEAASAPDTLDKNFYPCRFIAVKPKKLVIASDGYYGKDQDLNHVKNFDKAVTFDIGSWRLVGEPVGNTTFTNVLTVSAGYEFLP